MSNKAEHQRRWRLKNHESILAYQREWRELNKEKIRISHRAWVAANPQKTKDSRKKWNEKNGVHYRRKNRHRHKFYCLKRQYGLTKDGYDSLLAQQHFKCAACNVDLASISTNNIHVDHCHKTQKIRGILCGPCNRTLGAMKDDANKLRLLAKYIEAFNS